MAPVRVVALAPEPSLPRLGSLAPPRAISSAGRAPPRQGGGHWFEPSIAHCERPASAGLFCLWFETSSTRSPVWGAGSSDLRGLRNAQARRGGGEPQTAGVAWEPTRLRS